MLIDLQQQLKVQDIRDINLLSTVLTALLFMGLALSTLVYDGLGLNTDFCAFALAMVATILMNVAIFNRHVAARFIDPFDGKPTSARLSAFVGFLAVAHAIALMIATSVHLVLFRSDSEGLPPHVKLGLALGSAFLPLPHTLMTWWVLNERHTTGLCREIILMAKGVNPRR